MEKTFEEVKAKVLQAAKQGKLSCAMAQEIAHALGVEPIIVGRAADEAGIKITDCQLGCFGVSKER